MITPEIPAEVATAQAGDPLSQDARALAEEFRAHDTTRTFAVTIGIWTAPCENNNRVIFSALPGYDGTSCSQVQTKTIADAHGQMLAHIADCKAADAVAAK